MDTDIVSVHIALVQLTHQMSMKSSHKNLMGFEMQMYEELCRFTKEYTAMFRAHIPRSEDEGSSQTEGGSS